MAANSKNRRYTRVASHKGMRVGWQARGERFVSVVTTLGLGGLFITTPKPSAIGEIVRLMFQVPNGEVRAMAVVKDSQPGRGMGLEFSGMGQQDRARLDHLL